MKVIGITGGVGAGKSTVLDILNERYNALVVKTDEVAKVLMNPNKRAFNEIVDFFGDGILTNEGVIDRKKLAEIIFNNNNKRMVLNSIVHPAVKAEVVNIINDAKISGNYDYVFIESALLIDDHYEVFCDELWYIYADEEIRKERLIESRGYSKDKVESIFASQQKDNIFRSKCQHVIDNGNNIDNTILQLDELLKV